MATTNTTLTDNKQMGMRINIKNLTETEGLL